MFWFLLMSCGPKATPESAADSLVGWHTRDGDRAACFVAPDFGAVADPALRDKQLRDSVRNMALQWAGVRRDGVDFGAERVQETEALLLADLDRVPAVAAENLEHCQIAMAPGGNTAAWGSWVEDLHRELKEEACPEPFEETTAPLDLSGAWQLELPICAGEDILLQTDATQQFRLSADGPLLTVEGDSSTAPTPEHLCPTCTHGKLILRFEPEDGGATQYIEAGGELRWTAPSAGVISVGINDADPSDNAWRIEDGVQDGASLLVRPQ